MYGQVAQFLPQRKEPEGSCGLVRGEFSCDKQVTKVGVASEGYCR